MKIKKLKAFTLVELVVVMAIFSVIMVGAIAMLGPVMKMHRQAAIMTDADASVDNIKRYMEENLRYADRVNIYKGYSFNNIGAFAAAKFKNIQPGLSGIEKTKTDEHGNAITDDSGNEAKYIEYTESYVTANPFDFFKSYYFGDDSSRYKNKNTYIMEIRNTAYDNGMGTIQPAGYINIYKYDYNTGAVNFDSSINPDYYDSKYLFEFCEFYLDRPDTKTANVNIKLQITYDGTTVDDLTDKYAFSFSFTNVETNSVFPAFTKPIGTDDVLVTAVTDVNGNNYYNKPDEYISGKPASSYKSFEPTQTPVVDAGGSEDNTVYPDGNIYIIYTIPSIIER